MARSSTERSSNSSFSELAFERPIVDLERKIAELQDLASSTHFDLSGEIARLKQTLAQTTAKIYSEITPWERVCVARHPQRPVTSDYIEGLCEEFVELHGDGVFGDDRAIVTGLGRIGGRRVMILGHRKGRTTKTRLACNFGCAHPEGYRKALRKMRLAERLRLPLVCFINTPGAYPGIGAEERGQARAIAENIYAMFELKVPIVVLVIGEGGSGGALGIGVGDRVMMLSNSYYSVISPEGCAAILWKNGEKAPEAASALRLTAPDLLKLGVIDQVVEEPVGGAHRHRAETVQLVKSAILGALDEIAAIPVPELLARRYEKFRHIGANGVALV
jgi:acetyl-CoA carboxylase carboxyl transferase subunit alpha